MFLKRHMYTPFRSVGETIMCNPILDILVCIIYYSSSLYSTSKLRKMLSSLTLLHKSIRVVAVVVLIAYSQGDRVRVSNLFICHDRHWVEHVL